MSSGDWLPLQEIAFPNAGRAPLCYLLRSYHRGLILSVGKRHYFSHNVDANTKQTMQMHDKLTKTRDTIAFWPPTHLHFRRDNANKYCINRKQEHAKLPTREYLKNMKTKQCNFGIINVQIHALYTSIIACPAAVCFGSSKTGVWRNHQISFLRA